MGEYDDTLTLEGKIAVDFAHAMIAYNGAVIADHASPAIIAADRLMKLKPVPLILPKPFVWYSCYSPLASPRYNGILTRDQIQRMMSAITKDIIKPNEDGRYYVMVSPEFAAARAYD
ncbi:unnamed protein product [Sphagnum compactum]